MTDSESIQHLLGENLRLNAAVQELRRFILQIRPHLFPDDGVADGEDRGPDEVGNARFVQIHLHAGGTDGNDTQEADYRYDLKTIAGVTIADNVALARPREKGHVVIQPAAAEGWGLGLCFVSIGPGGLLGYTLWDAGETYDTDLCIPPET